MGIIGLVGGLILLIMYDSGTTLYWVAIGGLCGGALFAVLVIVYACSINRHDWKMYGCINLKLPQKTLAKTLSMMPSKQEIERASEVKGHVNNASDNRNSKTSLDWDPETVLPD